MNGPGDWEAKYRSALASLVEAYTAMLNARMEYGASGGDAWLALAGIPESKRQSYEMSLGVFGKVEEALVSDPTYIPIFFAARNGEIPISMQIPVDPPIEEPPVEEPAP